MYPKFRREGIEGSYLKSVSTASEYDKLRWDGIWYERLDKKSDNGDMQHAVG